MLDACAELLDEVGYEALSTTRIAQRAGVAIGSLYQFFPDKRAISKALTARNAERFVTRVGRRFMVEEFATVWEAIDAIIDEYVDMHRTVPGFRSLHLVDVADLHTLDSVADAAAVVVGRLRALLLADYGVADSEELDRAMLVAAEAADAVLKLAFRRDRQGDAAIIAEAKQIVRDCLDRRLRASA
ncbi:TetR family transcriptional regulator [Thermopolyspora flexuosa]|uniref:TetR family transcriptional regulator n=2 Tax=Thermopolyspora flexuosa TaxID=103836 RepID=A0A543J3M8_9ACTN|nr:TetR family transcriptional regulator [Thermopolyspora flexuosa]